jgi:hypothetical protein
MTLDRRAFLATTACAALAGCAPSRSSPREPAVAIRGLWERHVAGSSRQVDHGPLAVLLERHVIERSDGVHLFAYGDLSADERGSLDGYIHELAGFAIDSLDRREQYAFWLNLYNALVLRLVLSRYLVLSIRDIRFGVGPFGDGPFERELVAVLGQPLSLSDIRDGILWPIFKDPRLHYGLCDAAIGSPNLQRRVFTGERVDRMLDGAALDFVNHPRCVRSEGKDLVLSGVYERHVEVFGGSLAKVLEHVASYVTPGSARTLVENQTARFEFDWSLNDGTGLRNRPA